MEYTTLGRTGLSVSRLCLGTMNLADRADAIRAHAVFDEGLERGITFFDTANVYGNKPHEGVTEQLLGDWFAQGGRRRERVVLATKLCGAMGALPSERGCSAYHIRAACEASLRRMKTDRIDLYQMHAFDRATPWEEVWQAMDQLVTAGKVLYVGSSNFAGWQVATACLTARQRGSLGLVCEQARYNLNCRSAELEVLPSCQYHGIGVIPYSPLDAGLLGGALRSEDGLRRASDGMRRRVEQHRPQLERWEALCAELGEKPADVALAWLLRHPAVTAPIIGPRTVDQVTSIQRALAIRLDAATLAELDRIWPGPGMQAPEARRQAKARA
jgi:aryl-alcohol dehydrogenase-like predicted oxidoreductase